MKNDENVVSTRDDLTARRLPASKTSDTVSVSKGRPALDRRHVADHANQKIENAVYAHIQALRALGHTRVNTTEIADALKLSNSAVVAAIRSLTSKGVKVAK
jgi:hypothetical protein